MNGNLTLKLFRDLRITLPAYAIGILLYVVMIVGVYPAIRQNTKMLDDYMKSFPPAMLKAFGIEGSMTTFSGFISGEFLNLMWVVIVAAFAISFGGSLVAKEIESGTIELLLSAPISRLRVIATKIGVLAVGLFLLVVISIATIVLMAPLVDASVDMGNMAKVGLLGFAFFLAIGGYSTLFSSFSSDRGRATILAVVVTLVFYLVNFASAYWAGLESLKYLSAFYYYHPLPVLNGADMPWRDLAVYFGVAFVCYGAAAAIFQRRDITV